MKQIMFAIVIAVCIAMCGCEDSRQEMNSKWTKGGLRILTDSEGNKYAVKHIGGYDYSINPVIK